MMSLENKKLDLSLIASDIEKGLEANLNVISSEKVSDIRHYLYHDELIMAFEYLYLEIIESKGGRITLDQDRVLEIVNVFGLDNEIECMIDHNFGEKLKLFIESSH